MQAKNKTTHKFLWVVGQTTRLIRCYGASIDPHIGVQMLISHRQAMAKV